MLNKYLTKISNAVQQKNKENLKNPHHHNSSEAVNIQQNNKLNRNLEYERAIAASYAAALPKKKKPKINLHNNNNTKTCLSSDELAIIIKGNDYNAPATKRHTLNESSSSPSQSIYSCTPPLRQAKSSLTLQLSTSPSSGIFSNVSSSYGSATNSLQAISSAASSCAVSSSSSTESLNSSAASETPYSSNVSTPSSLPTGNPVWPVSTRLHLPQELAMLRIRMWIFP